MRHIFKRHLAPILVIGLISGCKTSDNISDTSRSGAQELLLNNALEGTLCKIDFGYFTGLDVYYDNSNLDAPDKGWINYRIRESLLNRGARLKVNRDDADVVLEAAVGTYGTSSRTRSCGVFNGNNLPDITISRFDIQYGSTVLSLLATDRKTGQMVWQSGPKRCDSYLSSRYLFGAGPFYDGTVRHPAETFEPFRSQRSLIPGKAKIGSASN